MELRLIYGCPGSRKSEQISELIRQSLMKKKKVILIVPERFSVTAEKQVTEYCRDADKLNLEVLSFRRLCNRVFREYGGLCYNYAGVGGRMLMMWRALDEVRDKLTAYKNLQLRDSGTIETMLESIVSFKRAAIGASDFKTAAERCGEGSLKNKLSDLALIYEAYERRIRMSKFDDPEDDLRLLSETLSKKSFFADKEVYVDTLSAFSGQELAILRHAIGESPAVTVGLERLPGEKREIFKKLEWCESALRAAADAVGAPVIEIGRHESAAYKKDDLVHLEKWLYDPLAKPYEGEERNVILRVCPDVYEECKTIAARILRDVQEKGGRYRDHCVAVRDLSSYAGIIDRVFEANGIPFTMKAGRPLSCRSAFRLIRSALRLVTASFRTEDLFTYLRTGFTGISEDDCFLLEDYVNIWNVEGYRRWADERGFFMNPDGRTETLSDEGRAKLERINGTAEDGTGGFIGIRRQLMDPLIKLHDDLNLGRTVLEKTRALYGYIVDMKLYDRLLDRAETDSDNYEKMLDEQTYGAIVDLLDELVSCMGDAVPPDNDAFLMMVDLLADKKELSTIPPGSDRVLVTDAFSLKPGKLRTLHAAGVCEGVFPALVRPGGMFSRAETAALRAEPFGLDLPGDEERAAYDEEYLLYSVLTQPDEKLYVTAYKKNLRGAASKPSEVFRELEKFYAIDPPDTEKEDLLYGRGNCMEAAALDERNEKLDALRALFREETGEMARRSGLAPLSAGRDEHFSPECAKELYNGAPVTTQSRLESFVSCPFGYTCRYLLKIKEKIAPDMAGSEIGTIIHSVFEEVVKESVKRGRPLSDYSDAELFSSCDAILDRMKKGMLGGASDFRLDGVFRRIRDSLRVLLINLREEFSQSKNRFTPVFCELGFGSFSQAGKEEREGGDAQLTLPAVNLTGGVTIVGKVDRVDAYKKDPDDGEVYLRVVDYKTGSKKRITEKALGEGRELQMPLYMRALISTRDPRFLEALSRAGAKPGDRIRPAAVVYHILALPKANGAGESDDEMRRQIRRGIRRTGLCVDDEQVMRAMDRDLDGTFGPYDASKKQNARTASPALSPERFDNLLRGLDETVGRIAEGMIAGRASATPGKKNENCEYCPMSPACRAQNVEENDEGDAQDGANGGDGENE